MFLIINTLHVGRLANHPGMAGIVPKLTHGVPCLRRGSFCSGNVKIDHRAWIYGCSLMSVFYFVLSLSTLILLITITLRNEEQRANIAFRYSRRSRESH